MANRLLDFYDGYFVADGYSMNKLRRELLFRTCAKKNCDHYQFGRIRKQCKSCPTYQEIFNNQ